MMEDPESAETPQKYEQLDQSIGPGNINNSEKMKRRKSGEMSQSSSALENKI